MNIDEEIAPASRIMSRYGMPKAEQVAVIKMLVDVGVEHCMQEMERIREEKESLINRACSGGVN